MKRIAWCLFVSLFFLTASHAARAGVDTSLVTLDSRDGVQQRYILLKPDNPRAAVILFAGGHGNLKLSSSFGSPAIGWGKNNFLVRTRQLFAEKGLMVAVVDAPSDRKSKRGMLGGFRNSHQHVADMDAVIESLRREADVPVWLVGTSRGTESAAYVAINSSQKPDGLVLTSSITVGNNSGTAVQDLSINRITMPVLVVSHEQDACNKTPPEGANLIKSGLTKSSRVGLMQFSGGKRPVSKPCQARSYHGFFGIESEVVDAIVDFINSGGA